MTGGIIASLILIGIIYLTLKIWLWLYNSAFGIKTNKKIIFLSLFYGGFAAGTIILFPKIMNFLGLPSFTQYEFSLKTILIFMAYLTLLSIVFTLIIGKFSKKQLLNLLAFNTFFLILFFIFEKLNLPTFTLNVLLYYLFVAYGEETVKNQLAFNMYNKLGVLKSDLLLYHLLAAIGFAFWENIVYLTGTIGFQTFLITLFGGLGIVITRGIIGFGAHSFYSSLIGMGNIIGIITIFIFILLAMLIHYGYDLSLYFNYKIVIPIFIIIIYFWISWIFYKIDRIYIEN